MGAARARKSGRDPDRAACHYDATTILRRSSRSLRPHCVLIRFLGRSSHDPATLCKTPLRSFHAAPRHYCVFATLPPRSDINFIFFLTTVSCVHVIMCDRLYLIFHDLLLLQAQQAELDVEAALLLFEAEKEKKTKKTKSFLGTTMVTG